MIISDCLGCRRQVYLSSAIKAILYRYLSLFTDNSVLNEHFQIKRKIWSQPSHSTSKMNQTSFDKECVSILVISKHIEILISDVVLPWTFGSKQWRLWNQSGNLPASNHQMVSQRRKREPRTFLDGQKETSRRCNFGIKRNSVAIYKEPNRTFAERWSIRCLRG